MSQLSFTYVTKNFILDFNVSLENNTTNNNSKTVCLENLKYMIKSPLRDYYIQILIQTLKKSFSEIMTFVLRYRLQTSVGMWTGIKRDVLSLKIRSRHILYQRRLPSRNHPFSPFTKGRITRTPLSGLPHPSTYSCSK